ncbi:hypothetical protein [Turicibacter sanguinis]|uniref:hypothetical protein n=1 Tax=Turicibacter sanguinis TaxID=154288 RepID=UPI0018ABC107|nr:hypothetical protein [Turicibacter sanguinis]MDB8553861.1 hypothetical protein [Turicibacter sanguinis]
MATMTKYYCDVCEKEVQREQLTKINATMKARQIKPLDVEIDVCDECIKGLGFVNLHYDTLMWTEMNRGNLRKNLQEGLKMKTNL